MAIANPSPQHTAPITAAPRACTPPPSYEDTLAAGSADGRSQTGDVAIFLPRYSTEQPNDTTIEGRSTTDGAGQVATGGADTNSIVPSVTVVSETRQ